MEKVMEWSSLKTMLEGDFTIADFIKFYRNTWRKNVAAGLVDMQNDILLNQIDPKMERLYNMGGQEVSVPVLKRLELRKADLQEAIEILAAVESLIDVTPEKIASMTTKEALAPISEEQILEILNKKDEPKEEKKTEPTDKIAEQPVATEVIPVAATVENAEAGKVEEGKADDGQGVAEGQK